MKGYPGLAETSAREVEPCVMVHERGANTLVYETEGDSVVIGEGYCRDPKRDGEALCITARRDDGYLVESYVFPEDIIVARHYPHGVVYEEHDRTDECPGGAPVGNVIQGETFTIGEKVAQIPGYVLEGMVIEAVAVPYNQEADTPDIVAERSPFEAVRHNVALQKRQSRMGGIGLAWFA